METKYSDSEMLKYLAENGIINTAQIQANMRMKEREKLLASHPYKVWQGTGGYWYTYKSTSKGRKLIKRKNKSDLEEIIIESIKEGRAVTLQDVFDKYLEQKKQSGIRQSTSDRYQAVFQRHFVNTGNHTKDIKKLSPEWFCDFIESECGRCKLKAKGVANLKGVVKGIIKRAKRDRLIDFGSSTVFDDLDIKPYHEYVEEDKQVFTQDELPRLIQYLVDNPDTHNLCILLMLVTGIRCGELTTLKFTDFVTDTSFNVRRCQTRYKTDDGYVCEVQENPKTVAGNRTVFIPQDYDWIVRELHKLRPFAEYLATNDQGERLTTNAIRKRLYRVCGWLGFDYKKSPHKCRKTYCSILLDGGADNSFVISQMGHTSILTSEKHYHYDRKTDAEKQDKVNNIIAFKAV